MKSFFSRPLAAFVYLSLMVPQFAAAQQFVPDSGARGAVAQIKQSAATVYRPVSEGAGLGLWLDSNVTSNLSVNSSAVSQFRSWAGVNSPPPLVQATSAAQPSFINSRLTFDGTNDYLAQGFDKGTATQTGSAVTLPDGAAGSEVGKGWTITGLARFPDGRWLVGNHGKSDAATAGSTAYDSSVIILSSDKSTILAEYKTSAYATTNGSVQGVAVASDGTIWFTNLGENRLYHLQANGTLINYLTLTFAPNALAYDTTRNLLIVGHGTNTVADWITPASATGAAATIFSRTLSNTADQYFYYAPADQLWFTGGPNGSPGNLRFYDIGQDIGLVTYSLPGALAIEGIWYDPASGVLHSGNDERYHNGATFTNNMRTYTLTPPGGVALGSKIVVSMLMSVLQPSTVATLLAADDPLADIGFSISKVNGDTTTLRVIAASGATSVNRSSADCVSPTALTAETLVTFIIDYSAKTVTCRINGVQVGTVTSIPNVSSTVVPQNARISIGASIESGAAARFSRLTLAEVAIVRGTSAEQVEGRIAWNWRKQALLASTQPFRFVRPLE